MCAIHLDRVREPKLLPCLHSFCRLCLERLISTALAKGVFSCPTCRAEHRIPEKKADGYRTNFTLCSLVELLDIYDTEQAAKKGTDKGLKCENGLDTNSAKARCVDCECYLCESCWDLHRKVRATKTHTVISLDEIKKDIRKLDHRRNCVEHEGEELKLYCRGCREVICRDCTIVKHRGHDYLFIRDAKEELTQGIEANLKKVQEKIQFFQRHVSYLGKVGADSQENISQCKQSVQKYFDHFKSQIEDKEKALIQELDNVHHDNSKKVANELEAVQLMVAQLQSTADFAQQLLEKASPLEVAMMCAQTCEKLNAVSQFHWDHNSVRACKWNFVKKEDPFKTKVCGGIHRSEIVVENLEQPLHGKNSFIVRITNEVNAENVAVVVSVTAGNGERLQGVDVRKIPSNNKWIVTYNIIRDGVYTIAVSVDGVDAEESPFIREWSNTLSKGMRIRRGKDWKWGDQDGGTKCLGTVIGWAGEVGASDNWVKVRWDNNCLNNYRWGAEGAYDLEIIPAVTGH